MPYFHPGYLIMVGPAILLAIWAQAKVSLTFAKFSKVASRSGYTGAQAARAILRGAGMEVPVEPIEGRLTDHYDPRSKTLRLSQDVYGSNSVAALGVAAHEAGHAIQHSVGYVPMAIRSAFVPVASFGSKAWFVLFIIGFFLANAGGALGPLLIQIAIVAFAAVVAFQVITLPVEFNASRRAMALLTSQGIVSEEEAVGARKVLTAAALTYVAAALQGILTLLYLLSRRR